MDLSNEHTRKVKQSISTLKILIPNKQEQNRTDGSSDKDKLHQSEQEQNLPEVCKFCVMRCNELILKCLITVTIIVC